MAGDEGLVFYPLNSSAPPAGTEQSCDIGSTQHRVLKDEQGQAGLDGTQLVQGGAQEAQARGHCNTALPTNSSFAYCKDTHK